MLRLPIPHTGLAKIKCTTPVYDAQKSFLSRFEPYHAIPITSEVVRKRAVEGGVETDTDIHLHVISCLHLTALQGIFVKNLQIN